MGRLMTKKELQHFQKQPYRMNLNFDEESSAWIVRFPDLPGCIAHGATAQEALAEGAEAKSLWIETALEGNHSIPPPRVDSSFSGKLVVRLPRCLNEAAAESAEHENISLNSYLVNLISEGVQRAGFKNLYGQIEERLQTLLESFDL